MGSKGQTVSNTNQSQTYSPTGANYITNALNQGQAASQLPFNIPQAPVAGFSQDQQSAFNTVNNAQGSAQPYYNQAQSLYGQAAQQPNVANFFNPMTSAVTAQMQNIFGEQNTQNTGNLTQAAGGVGADRIAVGQADLANQQGLAAGQTYANLYGQAQSAAQAQQQAQLGAGNALQGLGTNVLNAQLTGAQAQLGTGGLQQQLQQAQLNAPYQLQLAQAAFPYQQAQFNAGITGSLAPAMGGTTTGQGQTTSQYNPSLFGQIAGGIGTIAGPIGYALSNRGGAVYARGGSANPFAFASGGSPYSLPSGLEDQPINVDAMNIIPSENLSMSHPNTPSLNLSAPAAQQGQQSGSTGKGSNSGGMGGLSANQLSGTGGQNFLGMSNASQDALQDFFEGGKRGGVMGYADGGAPNDADMARAKNYLRGMHTLGTGTWSGKTAEDNARQQTQDMADDIRSPRPPISFADGGSPYAYAQTGDPDTTPALFADRFPSYMSADPGPVSALGGTGMTPQDAQNYPVGSDWNPYRTTDPAAMQAWRDDNPVPPDPNGAQNTIDASGNPSPPPAVATAPPGATPTAGAGMPPPPQTADASGAAPSTTPGTPAPPAGKSLAGFLQSPWAALTAGGLEAMRTGSVASGFEQTMKLAQGQREMSQKDTSIAQAAKRLDQEAEFHKDQFTKTTPYQQFEMQKPQPMGQTIGPLGLPMTTYGIRDPKTGEWKPIQGNAANETSPQDNPIQNIAKAIESGHQPPSLTGMYRMAPMVKSQLEKDGFNLSQATLEWEAAHKQILSLNGPQMVRFVGLANSVDKTIDETNNLAAELKNSGIPLLNQIKLQSLINTHGNTPQGQLAARYMASVNTLKEEFASLAQGGYAPHEAAWTLANQQINGNYGVQELGASLSEVQRLIRYRMQGIPNIQSLGPGAANKYVPGINGQGGAGAQQGAAPAGGGAAAPAFVGRTATNKQTGQKMREIAPNQWEPVQ